MDSNGASPLEKFFLNALDSVLVIVDIQERLAPVMKRRQLVTANCLHLIEAARLLSIPMLVTEQYPKGLGPTIKEIRDAVPSYEPIVKMTFDCCGEETFPNAVKQSGKKTIILAGMETHVCVLQTCVSLLNDGYNVHMVEDAVCSRTDENRSTGLEMMRDAGAVVTCTEAALFQLLKVAGTEEFKAIAKRIK